jgi:hypothetical protein
MPEINGKNCPKCAKRICSIGDDYKNDVDKCKKGIYLHHNSNSNNDSMTIGTDCYYDNINTIKLDDFTHDIYLLDIYVTQIDGHHIHYHVLSGKIMSRRMILKKYDIDEQILDKLRVEVHNYNYSGHINYDKFKDNYKIYKLYDADTATKNIKCSNTIDEYLRYKYYSTI